MLLALSRRYVCRSRTRMSNHGLLYLLLSQFSSSSGSPSSALGQGTILFPNPFSSNKDQDQDKDWQSPNNPLFNHGHVWMDLYDSENEPFFPRKHPLLDPLFEVLRRFEEEDRNGMCNPPHFDDTPTKVVDYALKVLDCFGFPPSDLFVLQVLIAYNEPSLSLSSYLAIFEWAGEQQDFHHTPMTFEALNKILASFNPILLKDLADVLDYPIFLKDLHNVIGIGCHWLDELDFDPRRACYYTSLLVANLIARKPDRLSHILRSLKSCNKPVFYNALVSVLLRHQLLPEADAILHYMSISLEPNNILRTTSLPGGPNQWDQANREYLRGLVHSGNRVEGRFLGGHALITLVSDHCNNKRFKEAADLIEEFKELSSFNSYYPYQVWVTSAYNYYAESHYAAPEIAALSDQMQTAHEACNLDAVCYTVSLFRLVRENRFEEASQLLMEMKELQFMPCKSAVSQLMCFLIKAGALHIALELYKLRPESQSSMCHYFLLNLLCGCGCNSNEIGCILAGSPHPCQKRNFDTLIQLLRLGTRPGTRIPQLKGSFRNFLYNKLILALCRVGRVDDAYLLYGEFNLTHRKVLGGGGSFPFRDEVINTSDEAYYHMIHGFRRINREDVADRLLLEMHDLPNRPTEQEGLL